MGGTIHFFLLTLYNFKNIVGGGGHMVLEKAIVLLVFNEINNESKLVSCVISNSRLLGLN